MTNVKPHPRGLKQAEQKMIRSAEWRNWQGLAIGIGTVPEGGLKPSVGSWSSRNRYEQPVRLRTSVHCELKYDLKNESGRNDIWRLIEFEFDR
jgi:hypothetical protein